MLAVVAHQPKAANERVLASHLANHIPGPVRAPVLYEDDFVGHLDEGASSGEFGISEEAGCAHCGNKG